MSTTYSPSATNTQAPAAQPDPDNVPLETLPADGDALNAASVAQPFKVLGDFIAWLKAPIAVISSWVQAIRSYRNARVNRVSGIDHFGFPGSRLHEIKEDWLDAAAVEKTAGSGPWFGKWNFGIFVTAGHVYASGPTGQLATTPWGPVLGLDFAGFTLGPAATVVESAKPWMYMSEDALEFEFDVSLTSGSALLSDTTIGVGLGSGAFVGSGSRDPINTGTAIPAAGAFLYRAASGGFWSAATLKPGGGSAITATTVAVAENAPFRYKIVIVGTAASDDGVARVLHYIEGALVANHAEDMSGAFLSPFFRIQGDQADVTILEIGPIKFTPRLALGDRPI